MKKVISVLMAVLMVVSAVSVLSFAAEKKTPVIVVSGMGNELFIENSDGSLSEAFPPSAKSIIEAVAQTVPAVAKAAFKDDYASTKGSFTKIYGMFDLISCDSTGKLKHNTVTKLYPKNSGYYTDEINENAKSDEWAILKTAGEEVGTENAYFFRYVWSESPVKIAKDLDAYIKNVKKETGSDKVTLIACSMGGTITMSYLHDYGCDDIKNVVLASTAFQGTEIVGQLFNKKVKITFEDLLEYFAPFFGNGTVETFVNLLAKGIEESGIDVFGKGNEILKEIIDNLIDTVFEEVFNETFISMPGIWCLIPAKYYEGAKKTVFPDGKYYEFIEETDYYINEVQSKAEDIIKKCKLAGTNVYITASYLCGGMPLYEDRSGYTDNLIDLKYASGGATVADYSGFLGENAVIGARCSNKSHNHISGDDKVSAYTCMFPEQTWIIKNVGHMKYDYGTDLCALLLFLATSDSEVNVYTDERFPQFVNYNKETGKFESLVKAEKSLSEMTFIDLLKEFISKMVVLFKGFFVK